MADRVTAQTAVAGHSPLRRRFKPRPVHVGFMLDNVARGQFLPLAFLFSPVSFISPVFRTVTSLAYNRRYIFLSFYVVDR
jgi:hypothetical protein